MRPAGRGSRVAGVGAAGAGSRGGQVAGAAERAWLETSAWAVKSELDSPLLPDSRLLVCLSVTRRCPEEGEQRRGSCKLQGAAPPALPVGCLPSLGGLLLLGAVSLASVVDSDSVLGHVIELGG